MRNWCVYRTDTGTEVVPFGDSVGHEPGDECPCLPNTEYLGVAEDGGDAWMIVHNAWDRQGVGSGHGSRINQRPRRASA